MKGFKNFIRPLAVFWLGSVVGMVHMRIIRDSLTVFCYHDVTNNPSDFSRENTLNVTPKLFDYQINFIKENFNVIEPKQLMDQTLPNNAALVTCDDGFKSFFTNAVPILETHKIPVMIFLNMGPIRGGIFWPGLIAFLCERRPDFIKYLKSQLRLEEDKIQIHLSCSQQIIEGYLQNTNEDFQKDVSDYVGMFADETDLEKWSHNPYVFYGNHSYGHYVSCLMSDVEFLSEVEKNAKFLRTYPNYLDYFAFPFGQPNRTFTRSQVRILLDAGVKKVFFSSASSFNSDPFANYIDRITLLAEDISPAKIKYRIIKPWLLNLWGLPQFITSNT